MQSTWEKGQVKSSFEMEEFADSNELKSGKIKYARGRQKPC